MMPSGDQELLAPGDAHSADTHGVEDSSKELGVIHQVKQLATDDPTFAMALMTCHTTSDAASLAQSKGICISAEALWRHRGVLVKGGTPTWRG